MPNTDIKNTTTNKQKARGWTAVLYPEGMPENWQEIIEEYFQLPLFYVIHDKDTNEQGEALKAHAHVYVFWNSPTTYTNALNLFKKLQPSCTYCEAIINTKYAWDYSIHNTERAIKQGKFQYNEQERITCNGFYIEDYAIASPAEKSANARKLAELIQQNKIYNFMDFYNLAIKLYGNEAWDAIKANSGLYDRMCNANYKKLGLHNNQ